MRVLLPLLFLPVLSFGQLLELGGHGGQSRLSNALLGSTSTTPDAPNDYRLGDGFRIGFRITTNNEDFFGHEFGYAYNRTSLIPDVAPEEKQGMAIHQGMYNFLLYGTREGNRFRPFATGGGHFSNFVPPGSSASQGGGSTKFGFNYGGGLKVRVSNMFMVRFDVRQYMTGKPFNLTNRSGMLRQNEFSVGFSFVM